MFAGLFQAGQQSKHFATLLHLRISVNWVFLRSGCPFYRSRGYHLLQSFQRFCIANQDAGLRAASCAYHDRHRGRQAKAQGQAIINTETHSQGHAPGAVRPPDRPNHEVMSETDHGGHETIAARSASRWMGARVRCASPTICTIWTKAFRSHTFGAHTEVPVPFTVPPVTWLPRFFTGIGSPVTIDSSMLLSLQARRHRPELSHRATRSLSPTTTCRAGVFFPTILRTMRAVFGAIPTMLSARSIVRLRALNSRA